jgi:hypothetical protein
MIASPWGENPPGPLPEQVSLTAMLDAQTCLQCMDNVGGPLSDGPSGFWTEGSTLLIAGFIGQYLIGLGSLWWLGV